MVIKERLPWLRMLVSVKGSSLPRTYARILLITLLSVFVTFIQLGYDVENFSLTPTPFTLIGLALGIFLGFRNNAAYDRFWEGRKLWGQLVNSARSFARQSLTLVGPPGDHSEEIVRFRKDLVRHVIAFVHALRHHLRESDPFPDLE